MPRAQHHFPAGCRRGDKPSRDRVPACTRSSDCDSKGPPSKINGQRLCPERHNYPQSLGPIVSGDAVSPPGTTACGRALEDNCKGVSRIRLVSRDITALCWSEKQCVLQWQSGIDLVRRRSPEPSPGAGSCCPAWPGPARHTRTPGPGPWPNGA